jgi:multidrug efflux pump subunit AcrA (membrane-fusion protein)
MSTAGPIDPLPQSFGHSGRIDPISESAGDSDTTAIDARLIQQTKNEIRQLVNEIGQLAKHDLPPDQFYEAFLQRVVQALASEGGALWTMDDRAALKLEYQVNLPRSSVLDDPVAQRQHASLLKNILDNAQPTLVPPRSGSSDVAEAGNPSEFLLVLAVIKVENEVRGVVEIFQRPGGGPTTQRGYLRFLVQMSELAGDYLKNRRLRHLGDRQTLWDNLEQFLDQLHRSLDVRNTAYTIVNESRRLIGCDRVSLTIRRGRTEHVAAVSGLDTLDRRADQVQRLGRLTHVVNRTGRSLWYTGGTADVAPQIEAPLQAYLDESHATLLAVIPLLRPTASATDEQDARSSTNDVIGALVVEQLEDSHFHEGFRERVETVAHHSATALTNARDHEGLFLMPVWRALGQARWVVEARTLPKTLLIVILAAALLLSLIVVPADFDLAARGKLQPAVRRDVFARADGVVVEVPVHHEQVVETGDLLVRMTNDSLEVEIEKLIGRKRTIHERIRSVKRSQLNGRLRVDDQNRLDGELLELLQVELGIDRELDLQQQTRDELAVRSPTNGQVVTWNVDKTLLRRPVRIGQVLMTVVDPSNAWELELYMPERRMGHIVAASQGSDEPLRATFILTSHPGHHFTGSILEIDRTAEIHGEEGNAVRLRVAIDKAELPELRTGTTVTAKVHCGRRSIGYVLFHELISTVQKKVLFWF